jgi:zinc/manganese transport system permease protein
VEALIQSQLFWNAFWGGTIAAILAGAVGYFLVLRSLAFASEALTDIGFTGATGGLLIGLSPLLGMIGLGVLAVFFLARQEHRIKGKDIEVGMALSFALGLGVLFMNLHARNSGSHASSGVGILFGSLMSVSPTDIIISLVAGFVVLSILGFLFRPLLFASVDPAAARARGVPTKLVGLLFLLLLAITTGLCVQVVGVLLSGSLMFAPAASAIRLQKQPGKALLLAILLGIIIVWIGLILAFFGPRAPVGFYITSLSSILYLMTLFVKRRPNPKDLPHQHAEREVHHNH